MRILIPCAGFGTRMNMQYNKSKELLINPRTSVSLIESVIHFIRYGSGSYFPEAKLLLIIRKEKEDLIEFCNSEGLEYIVVKETKNLYETVLLSEKYWESQNLVMLPDVEFKSPFFHYNLEEWKKHWQDEHYLIGVHSVDNVSKWGEVGANFIEDKPARFHSGGAFGVLGFSQNRGKSLLEPLSKNEVFKFNPERVRWIQLDDFKDLTRTGTIE